MMLRCQNLTAILDSVVPRSGEKTRNVPVHLTIAGISADSKKCKDHFLFVALEGATKTSKNGHDFIDEAIKNGAKAVVVKEGFPLPHHEQPLIEARDTRLFLCHVAEAFYDFPSQKLKLVGITGTNGKTSTSFMLHSILRAAGFKPKIMGTLGLGDPQALQPLSHTTMDPLFISEQLAHMANDDVTHVIMEISSHALSQKRVEALSFAVVALTNITQDHLDFHETFDNYKNAKARLFFEIASLTTHVVLPITHPFGRRVQELTHVSFFDAQQKLPVKLPLLGDFHDENAHLARGVAQALGISEHSINQGLLSCPPIPGRLESIHHRSDFLVFVDYAHTPHALEMLLLTVKKLRCRRIILVFGCGGDRDQKKRPIMGRVAWALADMVIITDDNPRSEDPAVIRQHIREGITTRHEHIYEIPKRDSAISFAIKNAQKNDVVVIAGKGHETYQIYQDHHHYFSDQEVAKKILDSL